MENEITIVYADPAKRRAQRKQRLTIDQIDTWISELRQEMSGCDREDRKEIQRQIKELRELRNERELDDEPVVWDWNTYTYRPASEMPDAQIIEFPKGA